MATPLILAWCDDLFVQGHQFASWITDYIDLEQSLAMGSISQELLAHSSALMGACGLSALGRDERVYRRPASEWFVSAVAPVPPHDWPATVARGFLLNRATLVMRRALRLPDQPRVQQLASVIQAEEDLHGVHWERWISIFDRTPAIRVELERAIAAAAHDAADVFGLPEGTTDEDDLLGEPRAALHRAWVAEVREVLDRHGYVWPPFADEPAPRRAGNAAVSALLAGLSVARAENGAALYEVYR